MTNAPPQLAPTLPLAAGVDLPREVVTQSNAILGIRGGGKTYSGQVLAEGMLDAAAQIVVLDPIGAWWGLRLAADGVMPGYPIAVLGGEHGDGPLDPDSGAALAEAIMREGASAILDLSEFRRDARRHFAAAAAPPAPPPAAPAAEAPASNEMMRSWWSCAHAWSSSRPSSRPANARPPPRSPPSAPRARNVSARSPRASTRRSSCSPPRSRISINSAQAWRRRTRLRRLPQLQRPRRPQRPPRH